MTTLDYGTLLCPKPIKLSIGSLRKPSLSEIYELTFERFISYEALLKLTPESYYTELKGDVGKAEWENFDEEKKKQIELYQLILSDKSLQNMYVEILDFFFIETVMFQSPYFILLNDGNILGQTLIPENIAGIIGEQSFMQVINYIQQTCCIYEKPKESIDNLKFKNSIAKRLYQKILEAPEKQASKKANKDHSLPNIISAVSNRHPCINPNSVWDLTIFQLIDSFNRLQVNAAYEINQTRVSVWGDEKKTFDPALWYKNSHDD